MWLQPLTRTRNDSDRRAAIVAPIRTAVGKFGGSLAPLTAGQLGAVILKALMERTKIDPARVDDVVFSQGYGNGEAPCIGHWSWLLAGLPQEVPGYQLDRRCGSGLQAIVNAAMMVQTGASRRGGRGRVRVACPMSSTTPPTSAKACARAT